MKVYEVWVTVDEYRMSREATCDSLETALEFAKTVNDWFMPCNLYEQLMKEENPLDNRHIREVEILTMNNLNI